MSAFSAAEAPESTSALTIPQIQEAMRRGLVKAAAEHLVAYRDGSDFLVPSSADPTTEYRVVRCGHQWFSWSCSCQAGQHGRICKHVSLAVFATKHHVHAKRPQVPALSEIEERRQQRTALQQRDSAWWADAQARVAAANERASAIFDGQY